MRLDFADDIEEQQKRTVDVGLVSEYEKHR